MDAVADIIVTAPRRGVLGKLSRDRAGQIAALVVVIYAVIALGAWLGWWADGWRAMDAPQWEPPSSAHLLGTNRIGQDIWARALYSTKTAFAIGLSVALAATLLGALLGGIAGFTHGSWLDELIVWLMGVLDSIPFYLFVVGLAFALQGTPYVMQIAMISVFWTTTGRILRAEVIKLASLDFVAAARVIGVPERRILSRHILPNTTHLLLVQATITFVAAIKSEVILSFLGLGTHEGVSWGSMIAESTGEIVAGHFGNFIAASALMFVLVLAFNVLADALQDALDPRLVA
jgi:ABC-type dipeptide/oligopeptide/nickel transport system permease subunit